MPEAAAASRAAAAANAQGAHGQRGAEGAPLGALLDRLAAEPALLAAAANRNPVLAISQAGRALALSAVGAVTRRRPVLIATASQAEAERLGADMAAVCGADEVAVFEAWETLPFERLSPQTSTMGRRLETLHRLSDPALAPGLIVASARALLQRIDPAAATAPIRVRSGDLLDPVELASALVAFGYRREPQVEHRGELAVRGSIVDVFPSTADAAVRIDLWGDEVDRINEFSVADQRSRAPLTGIEIHPCRELRPTPEHRRRASGLVAEEPWGAEQWQRIASGELFDGMESWLPWLVDDHVVLPDLLGDDSLIVLVEPPRIRDRAAALLAEEADLAASLARTWDVDADAVHRLHVDFERLLARTTAPVWNVLASPEDPTTPAISATDWPPVAGDVAPTVRRVQALLADGFTVAAAADTTAGAKRLAGLLSRHGVDLEVISGADQHRLAGIISSGEGRGVALAAPLERGAVLADAKLAVLAERDLTGRRRTHRRQQPRKAEPRFFEDLREGSYVVHHQHGVARFAGIVTRSIGGSERDYLLLEYRGSDRLYVPTDQIAAIRHYTGGDSPSLSRMGGSEWKAAKARVRSAATEIAQELVVLYQKRITTAGRAFDPDTPWQHELESAFAFQETPDQLSAIAAVKADMERASPMDRLLIGDVGFGKTEVALRAAFKAIQSGCQAAVLVPTTLLAQQHHATFSQRLAPYPVRVEVLSRFLSSAEARSVVSGLRSGSVDLVVGTHRLLSDDVAFASLGLLIVDEEQRFGVAHKEQIKKLRTGIDVLTLTATPIPRTLEMSLTGIRDMSSLTTPPEDRRPILTYVGEYTERAVSEAIRRELLREGQVFFVHNRVQSIEHAAAHLRSLVPEARVAVAHGQMDEGTLERTMVDFADGGYDVLVCTTIIESGLDIPTVNTLVVDRADLMGLGQLHQLRGRVGRSGRRAYAYLFHPVDKPLRDEAYERLKTIGETSELGSGFRIAMRDLEIRGAGNLLGTGQSGHMAAVGYDLYCRMVTEAVAELKGEPLAEPAAISIETVGDARLPSEFVPSETNRMEAYRRLAQVETQAELDEIRAGWLDRFGPIPPQAQALLKVARLRVECVRTGVREITVKKGPGFGGPAFVAKLKPVTLPHSRQVRLQRLQSGRGSGSTGGALYKQQLQELHLPLRRGADDVAEELAALMADLVPDLAGDSIPAS